MREFVQQPNGKLPWTAAMLVGYVGRLYACRQEQLANRADYAEAKLLSERDAFGCELIERLRLTRQVHREKSVRIVLRVEKNALAAFTRARQRCAERRAELLLRGGQQLFQFDLPLRSHDT